MSLSNTAIARRWPVAARSAFAARRQERDRRRNENCGGASTIVRPPTLAEVVDVGQLFLRFSTAGSSRPARLRASTACRTWTSATLRWPARVRRFTGGVTGPIRTAPRSGVSKSRGPAARPGRSTSAPRSTGWSPLPSSSGMTPFLETVLGSHTYAYRPKRSYMSMLAWIAAYADSRTGG